VPVELVGLANPLPVKPAWLLSMVPCTLQNPTVFSWIVTVLVPPLLLDDEELELLDEELLLELDELLELDDELLEELEEDELELLPPLQATPLSVNAVTCWAGGELSVA
jgi:hypothetical protein